MATLRGMASVTTVSLTSLVCWWVHQPMGKTFEQAARLPLSLFKCKLPCENPSVKEQTSNQTHRKHTNFLN